jgi:hypothetical protein
MPSIGMLHARWHDLACHVLSLFDWKQWQKGWIVGWVAPGGQKDPRIRLGTAHIAQYLRVLQMQKI